jgi:hypothetical protein
LLCGAAAALLMALATPAHAHRLDELLQSATLRVTPERVALHLRLVPGVNVAQQMWENIDLDHDGDISLAEQQTYVRQVLADTVLRIDDESVAPEVVAAWFPIQADVKKGIGQISLSFQVRHVFAKGAHQVALTLRHCRAFSVYLVNTLAPVGDDIQITSQRRSADQADYELNFKSSATLVHDAE